MEKYTRRDHLAKDRTHLANERTFLAYLRTSLAFFGVGAFIIKFIERDYALSLALIFILSGVVFFVFGVKRYFRNKRLIDGR